MTLLKSLPIILLAILGAVIYGVIHDQITARICIEYFTIGHPPVFDTDDPTLLGLGWGIIATWWVGLILGVILAMAARAGSWPVLRTCQLVFPLAITLLIVGVIAAIAGVIGHFAAVHDWVYLVGPMNDAVPADRHVAFLTDLWTHLASYIGGAVAGIGLSVWVVRHRIAQAKVIQKKNF